MNCLIASTLPVTTGTIKIGGRLNLIGWKSLSEATMAKNKAKTATVDNNMSTTASTNSNSSAVFTVNTGGVVGGNLTLTGSTVYGTTIPSFTSSGDSINDIVHDLKKEIGQLHNKIEVLEGIVREEMAEKYAAYKRIAEITKND